MKAFASALTPVLAVILVGSSIALLMERRSVTRLRGELLLQLTTASAREAALAKETRIYQNLLGRVYLGPKSLLRGRSVSGETITFVPANERGRTLLYSIVPRCPKCWEPMPYLNAIAREPACHVRVLGLVVGDSASFVVADRGRAKIDLLLGASGELWTDLPLSTPGALVLFGTHGSIDGLWTGTDQTFPIRDVVGMLGEACHIPKQD